MTSYKNKHITKKKKKILQIILFVYIYIYIYFESILLHMSKDSKQTFEKAILIKTNKTINFMEE